jgi:hypothetical protein
MATKKAVKKPARRPRRTSPNYLAEQLLRAEEWVRGVGYRMTRTGELEREVRERRRKESQDLMEAQDNLRRVQSLQPA